MLRALIVVLAIVVAYFARLSRVNIPDHLLGHSAFYKENLISEAHAKQIREFIKSFKEYPSNIAADLKTGGFKALHEDIGIDWPIEADGTCDHDFLVPNLNKTNCILPQRIDVGRHFVLSGGVNGIRESSDRMVTRVSSFGRYLLGNVSDHAIVDELFRDAEFQAAAKRTCPKDKQELDPFQFNIIIQVPGQTVALHIDAPYFWGASRFQFPQWLLAAMVFSNKFSDKFIDQVQVVGYVHERVPAAEDGGDFVYYVDNTDKYLSVPSIPLSGTSVDGSKVIHAANVYKPQDELPILPKDKDSSLVYVGNEEWHLLVDGKVVKKYASSDLRISIVYRARCFHDAEEVEKYRKHHRNNDEAMKLEDIISTFRKDLAARNILSEDAKISNLDLSMLIMDTYIKYPYPSREAALIPYNWALLQDAIPAIKRLVKRFLK